MSKRVFVLAHPEARRRAMACVAEAEPGVVVTVKEATRNEAQSSRFHAMCQDVSRQHLYMNKKRTKTQWKVLFISAHAEATKEGNEIVPGLEGEFVNIRESSAEMGVKRMSSLIDYTQAWGDLAGIVWSDEARGARRAVEEQA